MAKTQKIYSRLTRPAPALGTYSSLWLGPDHLLQVVSNGYTENYQRFDFRDIQSFLICGTQRRGIWTWVWASLACVMLVVLLFTVSDGETPFFSGFFLALMVGFLLWNIFLGPSCAVYLVTRVQTIRIPSMVRRRKVDRMLEGLRPLIEKAQSDLAVSSPPLPSSEPPPPPAPELPGAGPVL